MTNSTTELTASNITISSIGITTATKKRKYLKKNEITHG